MKTPACCLALLTTVAASLATAAPAFDGLGGAQGAPTARSEVPAIGRAVEVAKPAAQCTLESAEAATIKDLKELLEVPGSRISELNIGCAKYTNGVFPKGAYACFVTYKHAVDVFGGDPAEFQVAGTFAYETASCGRLLGFSSSVRPAD